ncbi:putative mediator of RNA polymerase II transcription subunit 13 [Apostichopus japonicus]|uniref:Mediator of RNA polymerase II transcription subunit 13 n=1 Tax=Stichopus japonicus TaxID=307972 RepID=A0A2G8KL11_STIJA|nr:putative mediator of RNA polymerase II transcription subunit 13 [Apostichopus japonicus]
MQSLKLKELCGMCSVPGSSEYPCILSACLVSLEPETGLRIMADSVAADKCSKSSQRDQPSCQLHTPDDATCTHIMVFPTSATKQDASATYQSEPINGSDLPQPRGQRSLGDDLFNDSDIVRSLFENPIMDDVRSPTQLDHPQGSPSLLPAMNSIGIDSGIKWFARERPPRRCRERSPTALSPRLLFSTAKAGNLPKWFWSSCPEAETNCPVFLKAALHVNNGAVQQTSDDIYQKPHTHSLDSNKTTDVLRYVLETYNGLSWLTVDPATGDRRSCLPIHMVVLMQLYNTAAALL